MEEEEERDDLTIELEEERAPPTEEILDRESRELLESESFEDVKEDLVEEKKEIKEDEDEVYLGHQMEEDDEEEEAKFNVKVKKEKVMIMIIIFLMQVKEEMVDPSELNMAPGWKVKFGKGRNAKRFRFRVS